MRQFLQVLLAATFYLLSSQLAWAHSETDEDLPRADPHTKRRSVAKSGTQWTACDPKTDKAAEPFDANINTPYYVKLGKSADGEHFVPGNSDDDCHWILIPKKGRSALELLNGTRLPGSAVGKATDECVTLFPPMPEFWNFLGCHPEQTSELVYRSGPNGERQTRSLLKSFFAKELL